MVPARIGSTRLKMKNLALINGKPMIAYAIEAARDSGVFSRVVVNSDNPIFSKIAERYGVEFYLRPAELGSSTTKSDDVVNDFISKHPSDVVCWVNPTSPLQGAEEIKTVIDYFIDGDFDSLITVKNEQVHCLYEGKPVNFGLDEVFAQTQDLTPVQPFVYSLMMWKSKVFARAFQERGHALFCGKVGYYAVSKEASVIIKTEEDLMVADFIARAKAAGGYELEYDRLAEGL